jgi:hypothetical protein
LTDILERAKDSLNSYEVANSHHIHPLYPVGLINGLIEEIETLRARPIANITLSDDEAANIIHILGKESEKRRVELQKAKDEISRCYVVMMQNSQKQNTELLALKARLTKVREIANAPMG